MQICATVHSSMSNELTAALVSAGAGSGVRTVASRESGGSVGIFCDGSADATANGFGTTGAAVGAGAANAGDGAATCALSVSATCLLTTSLLTATSATTGACGASMTLALETTGSAARGV